MRATFEDKRPIHEFGQRWDGGARGAAALAAAHGSGNDLASLLRRDMIQQRRWQRQVRPHLGGGEGEGRGGEGRVGRAGRGGGMMYSSSGGCARCGDEAGRGPGGGGKGDAEGSNRLCGIYYMHLHGMVSAVRIK